MDWGFQFSRLNAYGPCGSDPKGLEVEVRYDYAWDSFVEGDEIRRDVICDGLLCLIDIM